MSSLGASSSGFSPNGLRCVEKMVCRLCLLWFVFLLQSVLSQGWIGCWKNNPCETQTVSNRKEFNCAPSIQEQLLFHQSVLELLESKPNNFWNPRNIRTVSCCFLHGWVEANASSEKSRVPCFANTFTSFGPIVPTWTAPSDCRSSWS